MSLLPDGGRLIQEGELGLLVDPVVMSGLADGFIVLLTKEAERKGELGKSETDNISLLLGREIDWDLLLLPLWG